MKPSKMLFLKGYILILIRIVIYKRDLFRSIVTRRSRETFLGNLNGWRGFSDVGACYTSFGKTV